MTPHMDTRAQTRLYRAILVIGLVLTSTLVAGCAAPMPKPAAPRHTQAAAVGDIKALDARQIHQAFQLISENKPQAALNGPLAALLARYQKQYGHDTHTHYYCAQSGVTALLYVGIASREHVHAQVLAPVWATGYFLKSFALTNLGRLDQAQAALEKAVALSPMNAHFLNELAFTYEQQKHWKKSLELYREAGNDSAFSPAQLKLAEHTRALRGQGFVLTETGRLDQAEAMYHKALKLDPNDQRSMHELAYIRQLRTTGKKSPVVIFQRSESAGGNH